MTIGRQAGAVRVGNLLGQQQPAAAKLASDTRKPDGQFAVTPEMGAAWLGLAVAASGICPSPAKRPEVGSSPTQPAPGR